MCCVRGIKAVSFVIITMIIIVMAAATLFQDHECRKNSEKDKTKLM
jgi:CHASE3 domain sensor protein